MSNKKILDSLLEELKKVDLSDSKYESEYLKGVRAGLIRAINKLTNYDFNYSSTFEYIKFFVENTKII